MRVFPSDDGSFRDEAVDAMSNLGDPVSPASLQRALRAKYPAAVVRAREGIADPGFGPDVWYVYRYGSARPAGRWWTEPGLAEGILDDDRRFLEVSPSLAAIVEAPADAIVGMPVEAFSNPDDPTAVDDVAALWAQFLKTGTLDGTLRFRRLDGTEREIQYHVVANGAGRGRHLATVRELVPEI